MLAIAPFRHALERADNLAAATAAPYLMKFAGGIVLNPFPYSGMVAVKYKAQEIVAALHRANGVVGLDDQPEFRRFFMDNVAVMPTLPFRFRKDAYIVAIAVIITGVFGFFHSMIQGRQHKITE